MNSIKPKNRVFCVGCRRPKMQFESEKKALNFIKWNKESIEEEGDGNVPNRTYYCTFCCCWHITHMEENDIYKKNEEELNLKIDRFMRTSEGRHYQNLINNNGTDFTLELNEIAKRKISYDAVLSAYSLYLRQNPQKQLYGLWSGNAMRIYTMVEKALKKCNLENDEKYKLCEITDKIKEDMMKVTFSQLEKVLNLPQLREASHEAVKLSHCVKTVYAYFKKREAFDEESIERFNLYDESFKQRFSIHIINLI
jgi:hypothetical protein